MTESLRQAGLLILAVFALGVTAVAVGVLVLVGIDRLGRRGGL